MAANKERVIVIGAGASGLACARDLHKQGFEVIVLEACNSIGGRAISMKGFVEWKDIDLGAEFIHGNEHSFMELVHEHGLPHRLMFTWAQGDGETPEHPVYGGMSMYYLGKEKQLLRYDTKEPIVTEVNKILWEFGEMKERPANCTMTMEEFLKGKGVSGTALSLALAGYSNTLCSNHKKCALKAVIPLEKSWESNGDGDFRMDYGMMSVINILAKGLNIRTNFPVKSINYNKNIIEVVSNNGEKVQGTRVVVSASLGALKAGIIAFNPPLPPPKVEAIKMIEFENAMKIVLKFSKRFWPKELHGVICSDTIIPEFWFDEPDRVGALGSSSSPHLLRKPFTGEPTYLVSAFACSDMANYIGSLSKQEAINKVLDLLDEMFAGKNPNLILRDTRINDTTPPHHLEGEVNGLKPATACFIDSYIQNWAKQPYALGGYSSPSIGESAETRDALAAHVNGKVFFCGEHTNRSYMTINSAMKSGEDAAKEIVKIAGVPHVRSNL